MPARLGEAVLLLGSSAIIWVSISSAFAAGPSGGLAIFSTNGSGYPETVEFVSLSRKGSALTEAIDANGRHIEIPNGGILGVIEGPPS